MIEKLEKLISISPRTGLVSSKRLAQEINTHYQNLDPQRYIGFSLIVAFFVSIFALAISPAFVLLAFATVFGFFLILPNLEISKKEAIVEEELPDFLISLGNSMEIGLETGKAFTISSEGKTELKKEIQNILKQTRDGMNLNQAIGNFGLRYKSLEIKRAMSTILICLESGSSGLEIKNIGLDMRNIRLLRLKETSSKATMIGLVFVIISTMLPIFAIIYGTLGSSIGFANVNKEWIILTFLGLFPAIDLLLMFLIIQFGPTDESSSINLDIGILVVAILIGAISSNLLIGAVGLLAGIYIANKHYKKEQKKENIEKFLPDALLGIGGMPKGSSLIKIIQTLIKNSSGELKDELQITIKQLENNIGFRLALSDLYIRNKSAMLKRSCLMLEQLVETNNTDKISLLAQDLIINTQTMREKKALFSMQKYTLLIGSLLLPLMLSNVLNLATNIEKIGNATDVIQKIEAAKFSIPPYLVIYSAMSAYAISNADGKRSSFSLYFLAMSLLSIGAFELIKI